MNTELIIIGTIHIGRETSPKYAAFLTTALDSIKPDLILAEIADHERNDDRLADVKPEYPEIIFPYAQANGIETIGILPGEDQRTRMEQSKAAILARIESNQWMRMIWEYAGQWEDVAYGRILGMLENPVSMERLQMPEVDTLHFAAWFESLSKYFPEYLELWNQWNALILNNIQNIIKEHPGKRMALTIGMAHKYWLAEKLSGQPGVSVYDLISFKNK